MKIFLFITLIAVGFGCTSPRPISTGAENGLKDIYSKYFTIGVAVEPHELKNPQEASLVIKHYASLTAENAMKPENIQPKENVFTWKNADSIVAFAERHKLKMRGHVLAWHSQTPLWFFKDEKGNSVSKEVLLNRLRKHIAETVSRYKGRVYAWDVVNEVISDKADEYMRPSPWFQICGEEFIEKAFIWAHEADPDALLFYNDYNEINEVKRQKILRLIHSLKAKNIPIHGIGLQGHWALNEPTEDQLERTLSDFSKTGLQLQVTELDMSVYPKEHSARQWKASDADTVYTDAKEVKQAEIYGMWFRLFRKYRKHISAVTFWNISDKASWLDNFPVKNRKDHPLLFDKNLQPKAAYWEVTKFRK